MKHCNNNKKTIIVCLLLFFLAYLTTGALLPLSAQLGLDAFKVGKGRASDLKEKIPAVNHNK
jgi:hypothetical protein